MIVRWSQGCLERTWMMRESPRERSRLGGSGKGAGGLADKKGAVVSLTEAQQE